MRTRKEIEKNSIDAYAFSNEGATAERSKLF